MNHITGRTSPVIMSEVTPRPQKRDPSDGSMETSSPKEDTRHFSVL